MHILKNRSIRTKIIFLIVIVSTINIVIASTIYFQYDKKIYHREISKKLFILAKVIGNSNSATILFNDSKRAQEYMSSLKVEESVEKASIIFPDSNILVTYDKNNHIREMNYPLALKTDTVLFLEESIFVNTPVIFQGETIAYIRIKYNTDELKLKLDQYYKIIFFIIIGSIIMAFLLAYFFQKIITRPIFQLHKLVNKISLNKDFSVRSDNNSRDEVGHLSRGFNRMLIQIEKQNNELNYSKELAEASLKAKERFLANMTHELRTPLNSIVGITNLLEETELNKEQKNFLGNIKLSSDHLLAIINDLLEFSRLGSGKLQLEKNEFNLRRSIERIKSTMQYELKKRKLKFSYKINDNVPHFVIGDDYRLNQILINLVGNAIKFTPKGGIEISVNKIFETELKLDVEFRVKDTGIGIKEEKQKSVFESFTQESNGTTRKYGGTGLGLSITKQLVELQGGKIRVESKKRQGSTFIFNIPYLKKAFIAKEEKDKELNIPTNEKILLIDDNEMNLMFTKSILNKSQFIVETAQSAQDALLKIKDLDFDLILMDLHMPEMDGYELTGEIRNNANNKTKTVPIIALTAAATLNEINKCFDVGMNDYIIKPFKKEDLVSKILYLTNKK
ncbi:MAG: response regulator [Bacteroidota bacterium]